jgi:hypothetical protein
MARPDHKGKTHATTARRVDPGEDSKTAQEEDGTGYAWPMYIMMFMMMMMMMIMMDYGKTVRVAICLSPP